MEGSLKATDTIIGKYDAQNLLKYKGITEVTNLLRSVSQHAVNLNVEGKTFCVNCSCAMTIAMAQL